MSRVINHANRDGLDSGTGEPGRQIRDARLPRLRINRHRHEGIDQRDRIRARFLGDMRHLGDAGHVGGQLHDQRPLRDTLRGGDHFIERTWIAAKLDTAVLRVGTRDVEFVGGNALAFVEDLQGALVVFAGVAEYVGEDDRVLDFPELGQLFIDEGTCPDVLQADRVQHPGCGFVQARGRVSCHRLAREALHDESAELVEMHDILKFQAVAERPAGSDDRVLQLNSGEAHMQVWIDRAPGWRTQGWPPWLAISAAGFNSTGGRSGRGDFPAGGAELSARCGGASASVSTRPVACVGALMPRRDANVTARSTGSAWV